MADQISPTSSKSTSNPELADLLNLLKKDILLGLNCHAIATIQSFDSSKQTVNASINYTKTFMKRQTDGTYKPVQINYPILVDCPAIVLGGGDASLTFPITQGDQCLILFNDRDIDNWVAGGRSSVAGPVSTSRLHSLSDGIALVGLNLISGYDENRAVLQKGTTKVGVGESLVLIANDMTTLNTVLAGLCDVIATALDGIAPGAGTPVTAYKTVISELLE